MLRLRFLLLLGVVSAIFFAGLSTWRAYEHALLDRAIVASRRQMSTASEAVIAMEGRSLKVLTQDYTYWDDLVAFTKSPTRVFEEENLIPALSTFDADAIWVFDQSGKQISYVSKPEYGGLRQISPLSSDPLNLFAEKKVRRFFLGSPFGVIEIQAATINRTNDPKRQGKCYGSFFAGRVWDSQWLSDLRSIIDANIHILGPNAELSQVQDSQEEDVLSPLVDAQGVPVAKIYISSRNGTIQLLSNASRDELTGILIFACLVIGLVALCLSKWVIGPIRQVIRALETGNIALLKPLLSRSTEFGQLATVVDAFNSQTASLAAEILQKEAAEEQLKKVQLAVDCASEAITIADESGRVIYVNRAYCQLFGYTADEVTAQGGFGSLLSAEFREQVRSTVLSGDTWDGEAEARTRSGELVPIALRTAPIFDADGKIRGLVSVVADIRERQALQRRVVQSEKLAALGELVAGVAHEINNPLAAISGHAQLLEMHPDAAVQQDGGTIRRMAERANRIIQSLLTFSREGGISKTKHSLRIPVESAIEMCQYRLQKLGIVLEIDLAADEPYAMMHEQQIQQVVLNLITNAEHAVKGRDPEHRKITIQTRLETDLSGSTQAVIAVADTGEGMDEDTIQKIFNPFFTTKDVGEGTGLGLAICHGIIADHSGQIEVASEVGKGTTFTIRLTAVQAHAEAA